MLESEELNKAIAELSRAASIDPHLSRAHSLLAVAYERKGLQERAKDSHKRALAASRDDAQALNNSGYSLYLNGHYKEAVKILKKAAQLAPNDERVLNNLALAQFRLGQDDEAFKSFTRARDEFNARINMATMLERAGRNSEAISQYQAAYNLNPTSSTVPQRLTVLYGRIGHRTPR